MVSWKKEEERTLISSRTKGPLPTSAPRDPGKHHFSTLWYTPFNLGYNRNRHNMFIISLHRKSKNRQTILFEWKVLMLIL
ncbi:unnamed protein product [Acanthoscelides obtectus]|uniref:Uncharacterized protein n=1 Tax=Acanthoscelides obtectus TaxID=200917 RepID=A0A9P0K420_ACAOB|nr:unnamed protein product [Acanthoscelides obtectus]CAK1658193.1 hypothetical protein AOBTE_LOCUS20759 [Acanthoscelides obtectus]